MTIARSYTLRGTQHQSARHRRTPAPDPAAPGPLLVALEIFAADADRGRPLDVRLERLLGVLLRRHGATPHGGWLYYADGAGEVFRMRHTSGKARRVKSAAAYYSVETGRWA